MSGSLFQRVVLSAFCLLLSPIPEVLSLNWEEERREWDGLYVETSSCSYCGARVGM